MMSKLSKLTLGVLITLYSLVPKAMEFDWDFVQGGPQSMPQGNFTSRYIPGRYLVDVEFNGRTVGKRPLTITSEDTQELCLTEQWLGDAGIPINEEFYATDFDAKRGCYFIERDESTFIEFDFSTQSMSFSLPQKGIRKVDRGNTTLDYGIPALRVNYNVNVSMNEVDTTTFGSAGLMANVGRWVVNSSISASEDDVFLSTLTATRALYDWKADLTVGRTYGGNTLIGGAGLTGFSISSDSSMRPNHLGYSPVFSGIAKSNARVTITQNGRAIYSEMVSPGPFEIRDVPLLGSGDVTMTITENDGSVISQYFPLTIVPEMLNPNEWQYSVSAGVRDSGDSDKLEGVFVAGNLGYGFGHSTVTGATLLHNKYGALGGSIVQSLGEWGSLGLEAAYSDAKYDDGGVRNGGKFSATYAKTFKDDFNVQVIDAQYMSRDFVEFSNFSPWDKGDKSGYRQKTRYEVNLNQQLNNRLSLGLSGWHSIYWDNYESGTGLNGRMSAQFDRFKASIGFTYSQINRHDSSNASLNVSVPFSAFDKNFSSNASVTVNDAGDSSYSAGISSSINDRINYSTSMSLASGNSDKTYSLQSEYQGDRFLLQAQYSQNSGRNTGSMSISGSVIALPEEKDVIFTRDMSDTITIANIADTEGVVFVSSPYPTNAKGNAVVPVTAYQENQVTLSGDSLPLDVELLDTNLRVKPSGRSVTYLPFNAVKVKRYLLQVKDKAGQPLPNGSWAESDTGVPLGFITQGGVLLVNSIDTLTGFHVGSCKVTTITDTTQLQEVMCEE